MIGALVGIWERARSLISQRKMLSLFVLGVAGGLQVATMFWTWSYSRQIEISKQESQLQRSISELNSRIRDQNREEPCQQKERPRAVAAPRILPKTDVPTAKTQPQLPADVESARVALRYVEGAREYSRRGEEVRAIEAYVSAAQALPKAFLNRRGSLPAVDLNDREARSKLLAAFQNLFAETTLDRLREMTKGDLP